MRDLTMYEENTETAITKDFVLEHQALVKKLALYMKRRLPSHIELNDLLQSGYLGLLEAKKNFDPEKNVRFETFASLRIHGAMVDFLRKNSWANRDALKNMRLIADAISQLEQEGHKQPSNSEIAKRMNIDDEEYMKICQQISICNVVNLDYLDSDDSQLSHEGTSPQEINQKEEMIGFIKKQITILPEREQLVLSLYYVEEFSMKQIGEILDLTEARICQLHGQAIAKLQTRCKAGLR